MDSLPMTPLLSGLINFAIYFITALGLLLVFKWVYPLITPHKEWKLVKDEQNTAAAIAFSGAILGFGIALGSAASESVAYLDFLVWALVALVAQVLAYGIIWLVLPGISQRLANNETSAGIMAGATSVAVGILNAASMTY